MASPLVLISQPISFMTKKRSFLQYNASTMLSTMFSVRTGKPRDLILTNILEEGSSVDEPHSFEQDEQYLDECLKVLDGNPEELQVKKLFW